MRLDRDADTARRRIGRLALAEPPLPLLPDALSRVSSRPAVGVAEGGL